MKHCQRCGFGSDVLTDFCTRCGFRLVPDEEGKIDTTEYLPGIVVAAKKKLEESSLSGLTQEQSPELTYPFIDRRKTPRPDVGKRESKMVDPKHASKFYYEYQDPEYVPSILASAPPPPPPDTEAGVPSAFLSKTSAKNPKASFKSTSVTHSAFRAPVEPVPEFEESSTFKPLSEPLKSRPVRSPFKQVKPADSVAHTEAEAKPEAKKEQIPIWLRSKIVDFHDE
jgi:hypothetical protein